MVLGRGNKPNEKVLAKVVKYLKSTFENDSTAQEDSFLLFFCKNWLWYVGNCTRC